MQRSYTMTIPMKSLVDSIWSIHGKNGTLCAIFGKTEEKIIADEYYFKKFNEISISEIEQMISQIVILSS